MNDIKIQYVFSPVEIENVKKGSPIKINEVFQEKSIVLCGGGDSIDRYQFNENVTVVSINRPAKIKTHGKTFVFAFWSHLDLVNRLVQKSGTPCDSILTFGKSAPGPAMSGGFAAIFYYLLKFHSGKIYLAGCDFTLEVRNWNSELHSIMMMRGEQAFSRWVVQKNSKKEFNQNIVDLSDSKHGLFWKPGAIDIHQDKNILKINRRNDNG